MCHVLVLSKSRQRCILKTYFGYYHRTRTHLSLDKDAPEPRAIQPAQMGKVFEWLKLVGCTTGMSAERLDGTTIPTHIEF